MSTTGMTDERKEAMALGRAESAVVNAYLSSLSTPKKRGRKRTPDSIRARLSRIDEQVPTAGPVQRLHLIQERLDLEAELEALTSPEVDTSELEANFIKIAASYSQRKGISRAAWREVGVPAAVLNAAGIR